MSDTSNTFEIADGAALPRHPAVSVVMVAYNHEETIAQAIDGVVMQATDFPIELLIAEDCSTDSTAAIVREYQQKFPHLIRIVTSSQNVGMMPNYFRTLNRVRGKYVALCDGDDWWTDSQKLQSQYDLLESRREVSICFHAAWIFDNPACRFVRHFPWGRRERRVPLGEIIGRGGYFMPTASIFVRRDCLPPVQASWFLSAPIVDYPLCIWAAGQGECHFDPRISSVYRIGQPNSWAGQNPSSHKEWRFLQREIDMLLGIGSDLQRSDATAAVRKMVSRHVRTAFLETPPGRLHEILRDLEAREHLVTPRDRLMIAMARYNWASSCIRTSIDLDELIREKFCEIEDNVARYLDRRAGRVSPPTVAAANLTTPR